MTIYAGNWWNQSPEPVIGNPAMRGFLPNGANPKVPDFIVLDTREAMKNFRSIFNQISDRDMNEVCTQVFEVFQTGNFGQSKNWWLAFGMLVGGDDLREEDRKEVQRAFETLASELYTVLTSYDFSEVMRNDFNTFNYGFHSLRNNSVVLKHLSPLERY